MTRDSKPDVKVGKFVDAVRPGRLPLGADPARARPMCSRFPAAAGSAGGTSLNAFARFREGEPPGEPGEGTSSGGARPLEIMQGDLASHPDATAAQRRRCGDRRMRLPLEVLPDQLVLFPEQPLDRARARGVDERVVSSGFSG